MMRINVTSKITKIVTCLSNLFRALQTKINLSIETFKLPYHSRMSKNMIDSSISPKTFLHFSMKIVSLLILNVRLSYLM